MSNKQNGLALRQQSQALTPESKRLGKEAIFSLAQAVGVIHSQQAADIAYDLIKFDAQQPDFLTDASLLTENPRAFFAQIQKRIVGDRR